MVILLVNVCIKISLIYSSSWNMVLIGYKLKVIFSLYLEDLIQLFLTLHFWEIYFWTKCKFFINVLFSLLCF